MTSAGFADSKALGIIEEVWREFEPGSDTHWQELAAKTDATLDRLFDRGLIDEKMSNDDLSIITDGWMFPLHGANLDHIEVDINELRELQRNWDPGY